MNYRNDMLPDDSAELKKIISFLQIKNTSLESDNENLLTKNINLESENTKLINENKSLKEKMKAALAKFFSPKKDRASFEQSDQLSLFDEAETHAEKESEDEETCSSDETIVKSHARKKGGKRRIPDFIPSEEIVHELSDKERACNCCGKTRPVIGEDRSEELDIIPAQFKKIIHVVKKYGPCNCSDFLNSGEAEIKRASKPKRLIPYGIASAGLAAYCMDYKYNYAMPYYRLSKKFEAAEMDISRATLCNWTMIAAEKCRVVYDMMLDKIRSSEVINMDETRVQVLKEDGKTAESLSYMWVMKAGKENKKLTVFHYDPRRNSETAEKLLDGFKGHLQTDGYEAYSKAVEKYGLNHAGCMAHVRRKFVDAQKVNKESKTAKKGVVFISRIYSIETKLRKKKYTPEEFVKKRKDEMLPVLNEFKLWLDDVEKTILPSSLPGSAVNYALRQWDRLVRFLDHHDLTPDNNTVENAIRPFAVGRKNWLFSNTPRGAESSAVIYSLVESAKNNNLIVYNYLRYLFTKLPEAKSDEEIEKLLPCNLSANDIKI
ncbi:MAG TPA: IS66 family transposase [Spirochaetota bacterium]|nr:IS66 family transposase [Spirochaetota bacterium]